MNTDDYRVCIAGIEDVPELTELLMMLFGIEAEFTPDSQKQHAGLMKIISDPAVGEILVIRSVPDDRICGMVSLLYTISTALGGRVAVLEDMFIVPFYRRKGLGSMLISGAVSHAQRNGLLRISLLTDSDNHQAVSFYEKNNFKKSQMQVMRILLEE